MTKPFFNSINVEERDDLNDALHLLDITADKLRGAADFTGHWAGRYGFAASSGEAIREDVNRIGRARDRLIAVMTPSVFDSRQAFDQAVANAQAGLKGLDGIPYTLPGVTHALPILEALVKRADARDVAALEDQSKEGRLAARFSRERRDRNGSPSRMSGPGLP